MVRRTKEDSLATRRAIIAAARNVFYDKGVARTTLEQIATAAGVTRGAIYWHFTDKAELFYAMRDEIQLPLIDLSQNELQADSEGLDPLERIARFMQFLIERFATDEVTSRTFQIVNLKCEYVDEFARDLATVCDVHADLQTRLAAQYREAQRLGLLRAGLTPGRAATDTMIFASGLIRIWVLDEAGSLVRKKARQLIADHVAGKRAAPTGSKTVKTAKPVRPA